MKNWQRKKKELRVNIRAEKLGVEANNFTIKSCLLKRRYKTLESAEYGAGRDYEKRQHETRVYFCEICHGWHLTGQIIDKYSKGSG